MTEHKRGSSRFPTSPNRVQTVLELIGDKQKVADGLGISASYLADIVAARVPHISRTLDMACEAVIRRFGKGDSKTMSSLLVARVRRPHWDTVRAMILATGGRIHDEVEGLLLNGEEHDSILVVCTMTPSESADPVKRTIEATLGKCKVIAL